MTWQPMNNAPKDGTRILLTDGKFVGTGAWRPPYAWEIDGEGDGCPWANDYMGEAVAWMPLPDPPALRLMLYWIVHKVDGQPVVFIQEATGAELARLKASLAGFGGEFSEMHELPDAVARKVPKRMRGRPLTRSEAAGLLGRK